MKRNQIRIALVGSGGDGVMSAAALLLRAAAEQGLHGMMTQSYGAQIRGGESAAYLNISDKPVHTENIEKDLIICFRFSDIERFQSEILLSKQCVLIYEADDETPMPEWLKEDGLTIIPVPFLKLLEEAQLPELSKNILIFGALSHTLGWDPKHSAQYVKEKFSHKSDEVIETNLKALQLGYDNAAQFKMPFQCAFSPKQPQLDSVTGNQACAKAATKAGCRFFAGYPITPSSEILETMLEILPDVGGKFVQAEDEIAAIGMVVGASYGGVPSMTSTSGPGLSLMTEMISLSSKAEIPVVIVDCQRAGPATGMPSRTEQSDLFHAIYGGHGDFPRVVLAPTDVADCWPTMFQAFYISEKFQLPVMVLSDAYIAQRAENMLPPDVSRFPKAQRFVAKDIPEEGYRRFDCCSDMLPQGVSAMAVPGTPGGGHYIAGIEQNKDGKPSSTRENHALMSQKRFSKMNEIVKETADWFEVIGDPGATTGIVLWGSTKGAVQELIQNKKDVKVFIPKILHPFPVKALQAFLDTVKTLYFVELNFQGQLYQHVKSLMTLPKETHALNVGGGTPISSLELEKCFVESHTQKEVTL